MRPSAQLSPLTGGRSSTPHDPCLMIHTCWIIDTVQAAVWTFPLAAILHDLWAIALPPGLRTRKG